MGKWVIYIGAPLVVFLTTLYLLGVLSLPALKIPALPSTGKTATLPIDLSNASIKRVTVTYEGNIQDVEPGEESVTLITDIPGETQFTVTGDTCLLYTSPSPRD